MERGSIDKATMELSELAREYAEKAKALSSDPYFHQALVKSAVSSFVWRLYEEFDDDFGREALLHEMIEQTAAVRRAVLPAEDGVH